MSVKKEKNHFLRNIITGLTVNVPILGTLALIQGAVKYVDQMLLGVQVTAVETAGQVSGGLPEILNPGHYIPFLYKFPGTGLVVLTLYLYFSGLLFNTWLGQKFNDAIGYVLSKFPLISTVYNFLTNLMDQIKEQKDQVEKKPVWLLYTRDGVWCPAFDMGPCTQMYTSNEDGTVTYYRLVYIPTSPNPTSGMIVAVEAHLVCDAQTTSEEHMKLILSCGMTQDSVLDQIKNLAKTPKSGEIVENDDIKVDRSKAE